MAYGVTIHVTLFKDNPGLGWFVFVLAVYTAVLWVIRWQVLAYSRQLLEAYLCYIRVSYGSDALVHDQLECVDSGINGWAGGGPFISKNKILVGWRELHRAELTGMRLMRPDQVDARAHVLIGKMKPMSRGDAKELVAQLAKVADAQQRLAFVVEAQRIVYDERDSLFEDLAGWDRKATWLTVLGLIVVLTLGARFDHRALFALGAAGGLLSRWRRVLYGKRVPHDYGVSWSVLLLSPVVGAVTGWLGVLTASVIGGRDTTVFGTKATQLWNGHAHAAALVAALALGFGERLFTTVMNGAESSLNALGPNEAKDTAHDTASS